MDILLLFVISLATFFIANFIKGKLKIAPPIIYLALGVIFGVELGVFNFFGNVELLPNLNVYNSNMLLLMFFGAGFSTDIKMLKNSGKLASKLFTIPVCIEAVTVAFLIFALTSLLPVLGFKLTFFESLLITSLFAMSSPANIIPISSSLGAQGYGVKNAVPSTVTIASIGDNFAPFPLVLIAMLFSIVPKLDGLSLSPLMSILALVGLTIGIVLIGCIGILLGIIVSKLLNPFAKIISQSKNNKVYYVLYAVAAFVLVCLAINLSGPLKSLGILIAATAGGAIKANDKYGIAGSVGMSVSAIFAICGMPIVFMYVGSLIKLQTLFNPATLLFSLIITAVAIIVKGATVFALLRNTNYTKGEKLFAASACVPKGVTLVNFTILLLPILSSVNMMYVIDFAIMLAAVSVLITIPLGVTMLSSAKDKWLTVDSDLEKFSS